VKINQRRLVAHKPSGVVEGILRREIESALCWEEGCKVRKVG
jgi:hypothetical protein